jgi:cytochrome b6-f complex iron-sulfur subunit
MATETPSSQSAAAPQEKKNINRREFLNFAWLASLGFLTVNMAGMTYLFAMPRFKEGEFGGKVTIGKISELPEAGSSPENLPKVKLWLSNTDEGVAALYKVCTHLGCLYNWREQEGKFVCPCHGSQFTAKGQYIQGPAPRSLDRFVVEAVDPNTGDVLAQTNEEGKPLPLPNNPDAVIRVDTGKRIKGQPHG